MTDFNIVRQYSFPTIIRFGAGAVNELPEHLHATALHNRCLSQTGGLHNWIFLKKDNR